MKLALKISISLCIPLNFNTVLTVLISKPTKNCTVSLDLKYFLTTLSDIIKQCVWS